MGSKFRHALVISCIRGRGSTRLGGERSSWEGLSRAGPGWGGCCRLGQNMKAERMFREISSKARHLGGQDRSELKAQHYSLVALCTEPRGRLPPTGLQVSQILPFVQITLGGKGAPCIHNGKCLALIQKVNRQTGLLAISQLREAVSPTI